MYLLYLSKKTGIFIAIFSLPESSNGEHAIPKDKPSEILAGDAWDFGRWCILA